MTDKLQTWEAFAQSIDPIGVKSYARLIKKSEGYIYKQCRPPMREGRPNFLDVVVGILHDNFKPGMDIKPILDCLCGEFDYEAAPASIKKHEVGAIVEYASKKLYEQPALAGMNAPQVQTRRGRRSR